jgi:hypothetical protein
MRFTSSIIRLPNCIHSLDNFIFTTIVILSSLYVCMAIEYIIVLFVETPRKFITAKLSIRKPGSSSVLIICTHIISTDEDPGLRIESFAVISLRGVSTYY